MRLLGRVLRVLFAFATASTVAALVVTLGLLLPSLADQGPTAARDDVVGLLVGVSAVLIGTVALIPSALVIVIAEGFRLRSFAFYALAGAAIAGYCGLGGGFDGDLEFNHASEVLAASGIAAGLIYWLLAGRRAGAWRNGEAPARLEPEPP